MLEKDYYVVIRFWEPEAASFGFFSGRKKVNDAAHVSLEVVQDEQVMYVSYLHIALQNLDEEEQTAHESSYETDCEGYGGVATSRYILYGLD